MLHRRRERLKLLAEQEAEGGDFWTNDFHPEVRVKIQLAFDDGAEANMLAAAEIARGLILRDEGKTFLQEPRYHEYGDLTAYLIKCKNDMVPTVVEAMHRGLTHVQYVRYGAATDFEETVRTALREHRVKFDLLGGQIIPLESLAMHATVVEPSMILLAGDSRFSKVNEAFRAALGEIADGNPADAITDSGTALQEMLTELGCSGNALGPLIKSARTSGFLASHDGPMLEAVEKVAHWVSADRSERGDSHKVANVSLEDAWLMVHIVGALVLRLGGVSPRKT